MRNAFSPWTSLSRRSFACLAAFMLLFSATPASAYTVESGASLDADGGVLPRIEPEDLINRGVTWTKGECGADGRTGGPAGTPGNDGQTALTVTQGLINHATVNALGGNAGHGGAGDGAAAGNRGGRGGGGILVQGNAVNSGVLSAAGGMGGDGGRGGTDIMYDNFGGGGGPGGEGIRVLGGMTNSGAVSAQGGMGGDGGAGGAGGDSINNGFNRGGSGGYGGHGLVVAGKVVNDGAITAVGGMGGDGIGGLTGLNRGSGAEGGKGMYVFADLTYNPLINNAVIRARGGAGGEADYSAGGMGGDGMHVVHGVVNYGSILTQGGNGGDDTRSVTGGNGGDGGAGLHVNREGLINYGEIRAEAGEAGSEITPAAGAAGGGGAGILVDLGGTLDNHGLLTLYTQNPSPDSAAVRVTGEAPVTLKDSSLLFREGSRLELAGQGYIRVDDVAMVDVRPGAQLRSLDAATLPRGQGMTHEKVITADAGSFPTGTFNEDSGLFQIHSVTLRYERHGLADARTYALRVVRTHNPSEFAEHGNAREFVGALQEGLYRENLTPELFPLARLMGDLDHQATIGGVRKTANKMARTMTPQAFATTGPKVVLLSQKAVRRPFSSHLKAASLTGVLPSHETSLAGSTVLPPARSADTPPPLPGQTPAGPATVVMPTSSGGDISDPDRLAVATWTEGFYHTGTLDSASDQYEKTDMWFTGGSAGMAKDFGPLVAGAAVHYMYGDMDASSYDNDFHGLGVTLGLGRAFVLRDDVGLWTEVHGGYTHYKFDQDRKDYYGNSLTSEPEIDAWTVGGLANADFRVTEDLVITPSLGLDYTRLNIESYKESGFWGHEVDPENYDSLAGSAGLAMTWSAPEEWGTDLSATLRGEYSYEFADTEAEMGSRMHSYEKVAFTTEGQETSPHTGTVGAGVYWKPLQSLGMGVDYDLHLGEEYVGHQISAMLKLEF